MRLADVFVRWIDTPDRKGLGVVVRCAVAGHCDGWNVILFANPLDGGPPAVASLWDDQRKLVGVEVGSPDCRLLRGCGSTRWARTGATVETLTLAPSVNMHGCGHYYVTNGEVRHA